MIYGYVRVSTDKQTIQNQRFEIEQFCKSKNLIVDKWIEEVVSSGMDLNKRKLGILLKQIKKNDVLISCELSRLGRNFFQIVSILNYCLERSCQVWTIKDGYCLSDDMHSKLIAFTFSCCAELERNLISLRTKEALNRLRSEGKILGRPKGRKSFVSKLDGKKEEVEKLLISGMPKRKIAKKLHVDIKTLNRFIFLNK